MQALIRVALRCAEAATEQAITAMAKIILFIVYDVELLVCLVVSLSLYVCRQLVHEHRRDSLGRTLFTRNLSVRHCMH